MSSPFHLNPNATFYGMPELMGSVPNSNMPIYDARQLNSSDLGEAMPVEANYEYENQCTNTQLPATNEEPPEPFSHNNMDKPCLLNGAVIDDCSKSRIYALMTDFYLVYNNPQHFQSCRCPMENCKERKFDNTRQMIQHLKDCKFLSEGLLHCPRCNNVKIFKTTSNKKCSWDRPKLKQRAREKFENAVNALRRLTRFRSGSTSPSGGCETCGRPISPYSQFQLLDLTGSCFSSSTNLDPSSTKGLSPINGVSPTKDSSLVKSSPLKEGLYEIMTTPLPAELLADPVSSVSHSDSSQSAQPGSPSKLSSSPSSRADLMSTDVSPTSPTALSTTASDSYIQDQCLSSNQHQHIKSAREVQILRRGSHDTEQPEDSWWSPSTVLCNASSTYDPVNSSSSSSQWEYPSVKIHSLPSVQTNHPGTNLNHFPWVNFAPSNEALTNYMDTTGQSDPGNSSSFLSTIKAPSPPYSSIEEVVGSFNPVVNEVVAENIVPIENTSFLESPIPSPCSGQSAYSDCGEEQDFKCPLCPYMPSGKRENFKAYYRKHIKNHTNQQYKCDCCDNTYTRPDNRAVHRRKFHYTVDYESKRRRGSSDDLSLDDRKSKRTLIVGTA
ncbi:hypothetical protein F4804DRAFT_17431 [Jackrogersella minutella]|nr:hypothetical protein F4804DRAFT_17431 [Jackrogersella minutella]